MLSLVTGRQTPVLCQPTHPVADPLAPAIQKLIPDMIATMRQAKGVGLAANQIGESLRLAVIEVDHRVYTLINPEITSRSQEKILFEEGCLSLPGEWLGIVRSERVTVKYINEKGLPKKLRASGLLAIVIQHEVDHLDGVLIAMRHERQKGKYQKLVQD